MTTDVVAEGARIATPSGQVEVERLAPGDLVVADAGPARTVTWTGSRRVDCGRHAELLAVRPVRVGAGAIGPGVPTCDLLLSPDHALLVDGLLIPVRLLVNHCRRTGTGIRDAPRRERSTAGKPDGPARPSNRLLAGRRIMLLIEQRPRCVPMSEGDANLLRGERRVLEMVATGASLRETLEALIALIEAQEPGLRCGILVVSANGSHFSRSYGPSLPEAYHDTLAGLPITPPYIGACAEVADRGAPVAVPDVAGTARYADQWRELLSACGLASVCSTPIAAADGTLLGSFAIYHGRARDPRPSDPRLIGIATHLAALALERARSREAARAHDARLAAAAEQFASLIESAPFGTYVIGADFRFAQASQSARRAIGIDGLIGTDLGDALRKMWPDPFASEAIGRFRRTLATGEPYVAADTVQRRADIGEVEAYDWRIERIVMPDGRYGVVCYFYDMTERQRMETELRESKARMEAILDAAPVGIVLAEAPSGRMLFATAAVERTFRRPMMFSRALEHFEEWEAYHAGGRRVAADEFPLARALSSGKPAEGEYQFVCGDGVRRWIAITARPIQAEDGSLSGAVAVCNDVDELRQAQAVLSRDKAELELAVQERTRELEAAQARLAHVQRMEALGQLAGGIAHDFNNVLQAVQGGAGLIERRSADPDGVRRLARMVFDAAGRGSAITRRLLAFSRRADLRTEAVDPAALLVDLREILTHTLGAGVGVRVDAPAGLPSLLADKGQLETVLINMAANARDAMDGNGLLTLSASVEALPKAAKPMPPVDLPPGPYVRLCVGDTGSGMGPEVLARVTEPFFTTKPQGQGTGLGLAMARGFIEQSGGGMLIESTPGQGTAVNIWLPTSAGLPATAEPDGDAPAGPWSRTARLLVIDDEPLVRKVIKEQLEAAGHAVVSVGSSHEALSLLDAGEPVDLIVSDLSMPGMDGVALVREANKRRPKLPTILLTGFATNAAEIAVSGAVSGLFSLLRKPVTEQELSERVAMMLEGAAGTDAAR